MLRFSRKIPSPAQVKARYRTELYADNYIKFRQNTNFNYTYLFSYLDKMSDMVTDGSRVLDVGCGSGTLLKKIRERCPESQLAGVDISMIMLRAAKPLFCVNADMFEIPFKDGSFDTVVCSAVSEMFNANDFALIMNEIRRVVREGGQILVTYKNPFSFWEPYWWFYKYEYYQNSYPMRKLRRLSEKANLPMNSFEGTYLAAPPIVYRNHQAWYRNLLPESLRKIIFKIDTGFLVRVLPFLSRHFIVEYRKPLS